VLIIRFIYDPDAWPVEPNPPRTVPCEIEDEPVLCELLLLPDDMCVENRLEVRLGPEFELRVTDVPEENKCQVL